MDANTTTILVSVIGLIGTVIGAVLTYLAKSRKMAVEEAKREQKQNDQFDKIFDELGGIKRRLDEHNHYAEKLGSIEKSLLSVNKDIEFMKQNNCYINNTKSHARID